jgi:hypothetical protein
LVGVGYRASNQGQNGTLGFSHNIVYKLLNIRNYIWKKKKCKLTSFDKQL